MGQIFKCLRFIDLVSEWSGRAVSYLLFFLALIVGYDVVLRYVFNSPTRWAYELSVMFFGTFVLLGGAYTALKNGHVNMDVVYGLFSLRIRALLDVITFFVAFAFVGVLVWKGWETAWESIKILEEDSTLWGPPIYPFRTMLPLGAFLLLLQLIAKFIRDLITLITGKDSTQWEQ
jgi:TRAP-type mannitol/chloroaromatic compound transport system permease small subunit